MERGCTHEGSPTCSAQRAQPVGQSSLHRLGGSIVQQCMPMEERIASRCPPDPIRKDGGCTVTAAGPYPVPSRTRKSSLPASVTVLSCESRRERRSPCPPSPFHSDYFPHICELQPAGWAASARDAALASCSQHLTGSRQARHPPPGRSIVSRRHVDEAPGRPRARSISQAAVRLDIRHRQVDRLKAACG